MIKRLNPRERWVVIGGLAVLGLFFVWFALISPYLATMATLERKITASQRNLVKVSAMSEQIIQ